MPVVLMVLYAGLVHLAVVRHDLLLQWLALVVLCVIPQYAALRAGKLRHWLLLGLLAALLYVLTRIGGGIYALFLPPVVVSGMVLSVFAATLRPGQEPLVTRMAAISRGGTLPPEMAPYTRNVTWAWVLLMASQVLASIVLALFAPLWVWSAYTNFIAYGLLALAFVVEYVVRRLRFRHLPHQSFMEYLRSLVQTNYRSV